MTDSPICIYQGQPIPVAEHPTIHFLRAILHEYGYQTYINPLGLRIIGCKDVPLDCDGWSIKFGEHDILLADPCLRASIERVYRHYHACCQELDKLAAKSKKLVASMLSRKRR